MLSSITWEGVLWILFASMPLIGLTYLAIASFFLEIKHPKPKPKDAQPAPTPDTQPRHQHHR